MARRTGFKTTLQPSPPSRRPSAATRATELAPGPPLTDDLLVPRRSGGCRAGWRLLIGSGRRRRRRLLCLGLAAHCYSWLLMASAGGGSLLYFPVLDGNLGRRWWGLLPSGSLLSSFRSRCRSNWAERGAEPHKVPARAPPSSHLIGGSAWVKEETLNPIG